MQRTDTGPARAGDAIDISSANWVPTVPARSIYVGTGGDIYVDMIKPDGSAALNVPFKNHPAGKELPVACVTKIYFETTTASDLVALW